MSSRKYWRAAAAAAYELIAPPGISSYGYPHSAGIAAHIADSRRRNEKKIMK